MRDPKYTHHKPSGQARVRIQGKSYYLGKYGTPESWEKYHQLLAQYRATQAAPVKPGVVLTVAEVAARFLAAHAGAFSDRHADKLDATLRIAVELYGALPAKDFGPAKLKAVRQRMIERGWCRSSVNHRTGLVRRCFRWAVAEELIPPAVAHALREVEGLKRGRGVPDPAPVGAVAEADVWKVMPGLPPIVAAMVEVQLLTGMRTGEVCRLKAGEIVRDWPLAGVWAFRPGDHKTAIHGIAKVVLIGPRAQRILEPYLAAVPAAPADYLFRPAESMPYTPKRRRSRNLRPCYTPTAYATAVRRACRRLGVAEWAPGQLRHGAATRLASDFGPEVARVVLGHTTIGTTAGYIDPDVLKAAEIMKKAGCPRPRARPGWAADRRRPGRGPGTRR